MFAVWLNVNSNVKRWRPWTTAHESKCFCVPTKFFIEAFSILLIDFDFIISEFPQVSVILRSLLITRQTQLSVVK